MNVIFWGSSDFSLPSINAVYHRHNLTAVVTNPDRPAGRGLKDIRKNPVMSFALEKNIPIIAAENIRNMSFFDELKNYTAEIYVIVSYGLIIPENIINIPVHGSINLHASMLPKYRGASPIQTSLMNGDVSTGVSVQFLAKEMDRGNIIIQKEFPILEGDNYLSLSRKLAQYGAELLGEAIGKIEDGTVFTNVQDESKATYTKIIKKENGKVSFFANTAVEIYNKWRAFYLWPGIFTEFRSSGDPYDCLSSPGDGLPVKLTLILPEEGIRGQAGRIITAGRDGLVVSCREDALRLVKLKPSGKNEMDYNSFINGYKPVPGRYF